MLKPTIHDVTAEECKHTHECKWGWQPLILSTLHAIEACILNCPAARGGLESGCGHLGYHEFNADTIFSDALTMTSLDAKIAIWDEWRILWSLKKRVDQLHRFGHGGNLDLIPHNDNKESPIYAQNVYLLDKDDILRNYFEELDTLLDERDFKMRYWFLLDKAESEVIKRRKMLLNLVQSVTTQSPRIIYRKKKNELIPCHDDDL